MILASVSLSEHGHTPHYVPMEDPLVQTLLNVYEKQTGLQGHEQVIGGGTFGRLRAGSLYSSSPLVKDSIFGFVNLFI